MEQEQNVLRKKGMKDAQDEPERIADDESDEDEEDDEGGIEDDEVWDEDEEVPDSSEDEEWRQPTKKMKLGDR